MVLVSDSVKPDHGAASAAASGILRRLTPLAGIAGFLLAWQIFVVVWGVPAYLLPSPSAIGTPSSINFRCCSATAGLPSTKCWRAMPWRSASPFRSQSRSRRRGASINW